MDGTADLLVYALAALAGVAMLSLAALRAWRGWLELRRAQLLSQSGGRVDVGVLRARVKRLEAIATGGATPRRVSTLDDIYADYELLEADDRYRLLIDLGRALEPMPDALKTDASLVRGCSASVWLYPLPRDDDRLHFLADSNAAITKGIVALVLAAVQDRTPGEILATDVEGALAPFDLGNQLSSNRTQGIPNMIALVRATAERLAG